MPKQATDPPITRDLITKAEVAEYCQTSVRTIERWCARGDFPKPMKLGRSRNALRWRKADIDAYLSRLAREAAHAG